MGKWAQHGKREDSQWVWGDIVEMVRESRHYGHFPERPLPDGVLFIKLTKLYAETKLQVTIVNGCEMD